MVYIDLAPFGQSIKMWLGTTKLEKISHPEARKAQHARKDLLTPMSLTYNLRNFMLYIDLLFM